MTTLVAYNTSNGKWQVTQTQTGSIQNPFGADIVSNHRTREAAIKAARRAARSGEQIRVVNKDGTKRILRDGWTS